MAMDPATATMIGSIAGPAIQGLFGMFGGGEDYPQKVSETTKTWPSYWNVLLGGGPLDALEHYGLSEDYGWRTGGSPTLLDMFLGRKAGAMQEPDTGGPDPYSDLYTGRGYGGRNAPLPEQAIQRWINRQTGDTNELPSWAAYDPRANFGRWWEEYLPRPESWRGGLPASGTHVPTKEGGRFALRPFMMHPSYTGPIDTIDKEGYTKTTYPGDRDDPRTGYLESLRRK